MVFMLVRLIVPWKVGRQTLRSACLLTLESIRRWLYLRPPFVKRPTAVTIFLDRTFLTHRMVALDVRQGLLLKHLKPWLYRGEWQTPMLGFSTTRMLWVWVLRFRLCFTLCINVWL